MKKIPLNERIIFALDFPDPQEALRWVRKLDKKIKFFKVGLQLFLAGGWQVVDAIMNRSNKVMLDLKFFDIPQTVYLAVEQIRKRGIAFATVHGNEAIIEAAVKAKEELKILAVTVLTSFDEKDLREMGLKGSIEELVYLRAQKALALGCDGVVSSPLEAAKLRKEFGSKFLVVTPGIRPGINRDIIKDDQKRVATATEAILNGADHVVIGRPISKAPDPLAAVALIQEELEAGIKSKEE